MTIGERIKYLRESRDMTLEQLGDLVGVGKSTVRKWETGGIANMRRDKIEKLANAFHVSPLYILGIEADDPAPFPDNIIPMPRMNTVPLLGVIACGDPILAEENLDGAVSVPEHVSADFALRCQGDSMINARIFDGDIVYIRQQPTVRDGEIAAVLIDDSATLKRVHLYSDHISLEPENPQYRPIVKWGEEMEQVRILGKAVAFTSTVR